MFGLRKRETLPIASARRDTVSQNLRHSLGAPLLSPPILSPDKPIKQTLNHGENPEDLVRMKGEEDPCRTQKGLGGTK